MASRGPDDTVLGFVVEYFDPQPQLTRTYLLSYYEREHMVEMRDVQAHKTFLRKSPAPASLVKADLILGARVHVYGRTLTLQDYADARTRLLLAGSVQRTGVCVTEASLGSIGQVLMLCEAQRLRLVRLRMVRLEGHELDVQAAGPCALCELAGPGGPAMERDLGAAFLERFGSGVQFVDAAAVAAVPGPSTARGADSTLAVVLPHVIKRGGVGDILHDLSSQGFQTNAMGLFSLGKDEAAEFLEVYQGVVPDFRGHVDELYSGPCLAMELSAQNAVPALREVVGPWDLEIAREIRPDTLRAKYGGATSIERAIHCTDLPEEAARESAFFFQRLWKNGGLA